MNGRLALIVETFLFFGQFKSLYSQEAVGSCEFLTEYDTTLNCDFFLTTA